MSQSKELSRFYRHYLLWAKNGANEAKPEVFRRKLGLCSNLMAYLTHHEQHITSVLAHEDEMKKQFKAAGLNIYFPFSTEYVAECEAGLCHLNAARLNWVETHLE